MEQTSTTVAPEHVSEAARELNEKKQSWNPFKAASDAGKTLEEWKERRQGAQVNRGFHHD